jgi:hypothetical protein
MMSVERGVDHLVDRVVARRDQTDREQTEEESTNERRGRRLGNEGNRRQDAGEDEHVLDPVVDARDAEVAEQRRPDDGRPLEGRNRGRSTRGRGFESGGGHGPRGVLGRGLVSGR